MKMFPKTKWVGTANIFDQLKHLESELVEVKEALMQFVDCSDEELDEKLLNLKFELLDVKHSADSLLYMIGTTESEHVGLCDKVVRKNFERGYYKREG